MPLLTNNNNYNNSDVITIDSDECSTEIINQTIDIGDEDDFEADFKKPKHHTPFKEVIPNVRKAILEPEQTKTMLFGSVVEFKGYLVNVTAEDGFYWNSSQTRTDSGGGSCELVWVEEFKILDI